jgi:hypothetical protein
MGKPECGQDVVNLARHRHSSRRATAACANRRCCSVAGPPRTSQQTPLASCWAAQQAPVTSTEVALPPHTPQASTRAGGAQQAPSPSRAAPEGQQVPAASTSPDSQQASWASTTPLSQSAGTWAHKDASKRRLSRWRSLRACKTPAIPQHEPAGRPLLREWEVRHSLNRGSPPPPHTHTQTHTHHTLGATYALTPTHLHTPKHTPGSMRPSG